MPSPDSYTSMSRSLTLLNATIVYRQAGGAAPLFPGVATSRPATASITIDMAEKQVRLVSITGAVSMTAGAPCVTLAAGAADGSVTLMSAARAADMAQPRILRPPSQATTSYVERNRRGHCDRRVIAGVRLDGVGAADAAASLMVGLIVVAAGLLMAAASRRKDARSEPGEQQVA